MHIPPLARTAVDRDHLGRTLEGGTRAMLQDPATRVMLVAAESTLMPADGPARIQLLTAAECDELGVDVSDEATYLGRAALGGDAEPTRLIAVPASLDRPAPPGLRWGSLRVHGAELDDLEAGLLTEAVAILGWHRTARFSPLTGEPTDVSHSGWVRSDASGAEHFPRTDPAVIVLVVDDDDRILLGRNVAWPIDRFSLFAGFVEPGESLEAAVAREVFEEAGVRVTDVSYLGSQPWPFPRSLMLGFRAVAIDPSAARPDVDEISEVRWFSRDEVREGRGFSLPGRTSIARTIVEDWFGGPLPEWHS